MWVINCIPEDLGFLPYIISPDDPRPVKEQVEDKYAHGGGWRPFGKDKWTLTGVTLKYPDDPALHPIAYCKVHDENVLVYGYGIVCVIQQDGSFEVLRMD